LPRFPNPFLRVFIEWSDVITTPASQRPE